MDIFRVRQTLVCTERHAGLGHSHLRVLEDASGRLEVATDPVGSRPGDWVFTAKGTAGRFAHADPAILTDMAICGIIDYWQDDELEMAGQGSA